MSRPLVRGLARRCMRQRRTAGRTFCRRGARARLPNTLPTCLACLACLHAPTRPLTPTHTGAGILSSYGELRHMASGAAALESLDVFAPQPRMSYKDGYQRHYFAVDSLEAGAAQLRAYCATLHTAVPQELHPTDVHLL